MAATATGEVLGSIYNVPDLRSAFIMRVPSPPREFASNTASELLSNIPISDTLAETPSLSADLSVATESITQNTEVTPKQQQDIGETAVTATAIPHQERSSFRFGRKLKASIALATTILSTGAIFGTPKAEATPVDSQRAAIPANPFEYPSTSSKQSIVEPSGSTTNANFSSNEVYTVSEAAALCKRQALSGNSTYISGYYAKPRVLKVSFLNESPTPDDSGEGAGIDCSKFGRKTIEIFGLLENTKTHSQKYFRNTPKKVVNRSLDEVFMKNITLKADIPCQSHNNYDLVARNSWRDKSTGKVSSYDFKYSSNTGGRSGLHC